MSFILDALKKSDQQRQRNITPTLATVQTPALEDKQPALWWYGLLAAVLLGAGIMIGWMQQRQTEPAVQPGAGKPGEANAQKLAPIPFPVLPEAPRRTEPAQPPRESTVLAQAVPTPANTEPPREAPAKPAPTVQQPVTATASPKEAPAPAARQEDPPRPSEATRESGVIPWSELPPALQQEIPKLSILAHSYSSKPKSRFVFINDQMWHEEDSPVPGLKLERITQDGMIFSYKGYRFRRSSNQ